MRISDWSSDVCSSDLFPLGSSSDPRDIERPAVAQPEPSPGPISEPVELPHWTEPPTGQVPQILSDAAHPDADADDWAGLATPARRWRDETSNYDATAGFSATATRAAEPATTRTGAPDDRKR